MYKQLEFEMDKSKNENKGLLATAILLIGLFFIGYYGRNSSSVVSNNIAIVEGEQTLSAKE